MCPRNACFNGNSLTELIEKPKCTTSKPQLVFPVERNCWWLASFFSVALPTSLSAHQWTINNKKVNAYVKNFDGRFVTFELKNKKNETRFRRRFEPGRYCLFKDSCRIARVNHKTASGRAPYCRCIPTTPGSVRTQSESVVRTVGGLLRRPPR